MTGMSFILYSHIVGMTRNQSGLDNRTKIHEKSNDVQCLGVGFSDLHFVLNAACLERLKDCVRCNMCAATTRPPRIAKVGTVREQFRCNKSMHRWPGADATTATIIPCLWGQRTAFAVYDSKTKWATCLLGTQASHALPHCVVSKCPGGYASD